MFLAQVAAVWTFAVDVPFWDDWNYLAPDRVPLDRPLSWAYLVDRHNEHLIVWARLQTWLLYRVDGWSLVTQQVLNVLVYGAGVAGFAWACRERAPALPGWAAPLAACCLLSPLGWENFTWGFQGSTHQALLGFLLAVWLLGGDRPGPARLVAGVLCAAATVVAQGAGAVAVGVLVVGWPAWKLGRAARATEPGLARRERLEAFAVALPLGALVALWAWGAGHVEGPPAARPWTLGFWRFVVYLAGLGFGFRSRSWLLGLLALALVLTPLIGLRRRGPLTPRGWTLTLWALGLLAVVAAIAWGRAELDPSGRAAKSSRYAAFTQPWLLVALAAWATWLRGPGAERVRVDARRAALLTVGVVIALGYVDEWRLKRYRETAATRRAGLEALRVHGEGPQSGQPLHGPLSPFDLRPHVAEARRLSVRFTRARR